MRRTSLLALAALGASALAQDPEPPALRFAWPGQDAVPVRETCTKGGQEVEMTYRLRLEPEAGSGGFVVSYEGFEFTSLGGRPAAEPELQLLLPRIAPLFQARPSHRVSADGRFAGVVDLDRTIESLLETYSGLDDLDQVPEAQLDLIRKAFARPEVASTLIDPVETSWNVWVGDWIGVRIAPGRTSEVEVERPLPILGPEATIILRVEVACLERLTHRGRDCIRLRSRREPDPERLAETAKAYALASGREIPADALRGLVPVTRAEGIYEVETLRPHEARSETTGRASPLGGRDGERAEYVFDWPDLAE